MSLPKSYVKLSGLAEKWNKTTADLIAWITAAQMRAAFWYDGPVVSPPIANEEIRCFPSYEGWGVPSVAELEPLLANKTAKVTWFHPISCIQRHSFLLPASEPDQDGISRPSCIDITVEDLFVSPEEVERMERESPELIENNVEQHGREGAPYSAGINGKQPEPAAGQQKNRVPFREAGFFDCTGLLRITERWDLKCVGNMFLLLINNN